MTVADFRNYRSLSFQPGRGLNVLSGPNAQGKTNLLEALGLLLVGRSFRGAKAVDLPSWGSGAAVLSGAVVRGDVVRELRRGITLSEEGRWVLTGEACSWARAIPLGWQDPAGSPSRAQPLPPGVGEAESSPPDRSAGASIAVGRAARKDRCGDS